MLRVLALSLWTMARGAGPAMPAWLTAYPGAEVRVAAGGVSVSYVAEASGEQVIAHLRGVFSAAGVPFQPQANGMGSTIRARTEECSLLILIRESEGGTKVEASCAAPAERASAAPAAAPAAAAPATPVSAFAPGWPGWLSAVGGTGALRPVARTTQGETELEASYRTNASLEEVHDFYSQAAEANGFRIVSSRVTTRQSVRGNLLMGEPEGAVEACRAESGRITGPRTCVKAAFSGDPARGGVRVRLVVRAVAGLRPR